MTRLSPLLVRRPDEWPIAVGAGDRHPDKRMFGRLVAWGGARTGPHACCARRDLPLPVAAGAATLFPIVAPPPPRGEGHPPAPPALGGPSSFFVRLRRGGAGTASSPAARAPASAPPTPAPAPPP